jgi:ParB family chromosome partitioning protein
MPLFGGIQNKNRSPEVVNKVVKIRTEQIVPNPYQPRQEFGSDLEELAESIRANGILQPLTVREITESANSANNSNSSNNTYITNNASNAGSHGNTALYELVAGERRLRAAKLCGLTEVPCIIVQMTDRGSAVMALVENIQRRDLGFFDEAEAIARLIELYNMTQEDAAIRLGKSQPTIANKLRLLKLDPTERKKISEYGLTERHARALLKLETPEDRDEAIENIRLKKLNVEHSDRMIEGMIIRKNEQQKAENTIKRSSGLFRDIRLFTNTIAHAVDVMRAAGINAEQNKTEYPDYVEYTVRIPR